MTHPRHSPNAASSDAATMIAATSVTPGPVRPKASQVTAAAVDNAVPMPWANRLGAPGTRRSAGV